MNELVKKIMEKNRKAIDEIFRIIMEDKLPTAELIKLYRKQSVSGSKK